MKARVLITALLSSLVVVWAGCSDNVRVTGPEGTLSSAQPQLNGGHIGGGNGINHVPGSGGSGSGGSGSIGTGSTSGQIVRIETISAAEGGTISFGVSTLWFSAGALDKDTEIKAVDVSAVRGYPCVELYPEGIQFKNPVTLKTRVPAGTRPSECRMWWWGDDKSGAHSWIDIGGTVSADGRWITVQLEHFSTYAPGKAGWWKPANPFDRPNAESDRRP